MAQCVSGTAAIAGLRAEFESLQAEFFFQKDGGEPGWVRRGETALLGRPISAEEIRQMVADLS